MTARRALSLALFLALMLAILPIPTSHSTVEAAGPSIYWGAYIDGALYGLPDPPHDTRAIDTFEAHTKKKMSIFHWGQSWINSDGSFGTFQTNYFNTIRSRGSIPMITWLSTKVGSGATQPDLQLADIYSGRYDANIRQWATAAKTWGQPFFLRFNHEMNGSWYAWGEGKTTTGTIVNGNQPGDYVKAWRRVHDIFTNVGATNVTWVWCPNIEANSDRYPALGGLYPGDAYVDWTCLDGYNRPNGWLGFQQVFTGSGASWLRNSYQNVLNVAPNKPMMIGETGSYDPGDGGAKKAAWIKDMLLTQLPANFPKIKAILWFNWNEQANYAIESTAVAQDAFATAIASANYAANSYAGLNTSPIPPPDGTTTSAPATSVTLTPNADTYINSADPASVAGGTSTTLFSSGTPVRRSFIKFDLSTLAGKTLSSVKLRIHTTNNTSSASANSHNVHLVDNVSWTESSVSYNNPVAVTSTILGTLPANSAVNTWYDITLSASALQPKVGGGLSLSVLSAGTDGLQFDAREATSKPQLVITYK